MFENKYYAFLENLKSLLSVDIKVLTFFFFNWIKVFLQMSNTHKIVKHELMNYTMTESKLCNMNRSCIVYQALGTKRPIIITLSITNQIQISQKPWKVQWKTCRRSRKTKTKTSPWRNFPNHIVLWRLLWRWGDNMN